jgi:hypothetical protein
MNKAFVMTILMSVGVFFLVALVSINHVDACDYYGCSDYSYGYGDYSGYGGGSYYDSSSYYGSCGYSYSGCGSNYSYTQPYQYFQYPQISYVQNQNNNYNTGLTQPYQFFQYPQIVYVPNQQTNSSYNPYGNNTTASPSSLYYQAGNGYSQNQGQYQQYQGQAGSGYPYQQNYQNNWQSSGGQYTGGQYNNGQTGGGFIRIN